MENKNSTGIVDQVRTSFARRNLLATMIGLPIGGFVPFGTYTVAHGEISGNTDPMLILVACGLLYSATTVFQWGRMAFKGSTVKALGFAGLVEGIMTFSGQQALSIAALVILIGINAIATGCALAQGQAEPVVVKLRKNVKRKAPKAVKTETPKKLHLSVME
jgi:hypothetical protein